MLDTLGTPRGVYPGFQVKGMIKRRTPPPFHKSGGLPTKPKKKTLGRFEYLPPPPIPERKWKISNLECKLQWCRQPFMVWVGSEGIDINRLN